MPETLREQWERLKRSKESVEARLKQLEPEIEEWLRRFDSPTEVQKHITGLGSQLRKYYEDKILDLVIRENVKLGEEHIRRIYGWKEELGSFSRKLAGFELKIDALDRSSELYMRLRETNAYWNGQLDEWAEEFHHVLRPLLDGEVLVEKDYPTAVKRLAEAVHRASYLHGVPPERVYRDVRDALLEGMEGLLPILDDEALGRGDASNRRKLLDKFIQDEFGHLHKSAGDILKALKRKSAEYFRLSAAYGLGRKYLFSVKWSEFSAALGSVSPTTSAVPDPLRHKFSDHGISLSDAAEIGRPREDEWRITHVGKTGKAYAVLKEDETLNIYESRTENSIYMMIYRDLSSLHEAYGTSKPRKKDALDRRREGLAHLLRECLPWLSLDLILPAQIVRILELPKYQGLRSYYVDDRNKLSKKFYSDLKAIQQDPRRYGLQ